MPITDPSNEFVELVEDTQIPGAPGVLRAGRVAFLLRPVWLTAKRPGYSLVFWADCTAESDIPELPTSAFRPSTHEAWERAYAAAEVAAGRPAPVAREAAGSSWRVRHPTSDGEAWVLEIDGVDAWSRGDRVGMPGTGQPGRTGAAAGLRLETTGCHTRGLSIVVQWDGGGTSAEPVGALRKLGGP